MKRITLGSFMFVMGWMAATVGYALNYDVGTTLIISGWFFAIAGMISGMWNI